MMILLLLGVASAATLTVGEGAGFDHASLSDAVAAAADGDRIEVSAGSWTDCVEVSGKVLSIVGDGEVLLSAPSTCPDLLTLTEADLSICGLSLSNPGGRAVAAYDSSLLLSDCTISGSGEPGVDGAALYQEGGTALVSACEIVDNTAADGVLHVTHDGQLTVMDSAVQDNTAARGGGVFVGWLSGGGTATATLARNRFEANSAEEGGEALYVDEGATATSRGNSFVGSAAADSAGSGVHLARHAALDSTDDSWTGFGAGDTMGGAVRMVDDGTLVAQGCTFTDNQGWYGGAVRSDATGTIELSDCTLTGNYAELGGGALYLTGGSLVVSGSTLSSNSVGDNTGGTILAVAESVRISDSTISSSSAYNGGCMGFIPAEDDSELVLTRTTWRGCRASTTSGGALWAGGRLEVEGSTFASNRAAEQGGAIYYYGGPGVTVRTSSFEGNQAGEEGGALHLRADEAVPHSFDQSRFVDNQSGDAGGAIFTRFSAPLTLTRSWFEGNTAEGTSLQGGGAVYLEAPSDTEARANWFCRNEASEVGGALELLSAPSGYERVVANNVYVGNLASFYGSDLYSDSALSIEQETYVGGGSTYGGAVTLSSRSASAANLVLAHVETGAAIRFGQLSDAWLGVWDNSDGDIYGDPNTAANGIHLVEADPEFVLPWDSALDCDALDLHLAAGSPMIDAGDPDRLDLDGTVADLGAYGGEGAAWWDLDEDGVEWVEDCDDDDPAVYPGAAEVPDDGVDQDCDGEDLVTVEDPEEGDTGSPPGCEGESDGGAADGGATDGGAGDGGATDGGAMDGGATDGGATDGGASDGGASDGGASDGGALEEEGGKGCGSGGSSALLLLPLFGLRRRRDA